MSITEYFFLGTILNLVWTHRDRIIKNKIGGYLAGPFIISYLVYYVIFRLPNDKLMLEILDKVAKQKKLDDFI